MNAANKALAAFAVAAVLTSPALAYEQAPGLAVMCDLTSPVTYCMMTETPRVAPDARIINVRPPAESDADWARRCRATLQPGRVIAGGFREPSRWKIENPECGL